MTRREVAAARKLLLSAIGCGANWVEEYTGPDAAKQDRKAWTAALRALCAAAERGTEGAGNG